MPRQRRHRVFVSYHHGNDQQYKDLLVEEMAADIVDHSVEDGDIDERLRTEDIWEKIRDEHIADATVLLVLIGRHTWSRKFVDWEIGSALNRSRNNSRRGVLEIVLPDHPDYGTGHRDPNLLPQRLAANIEGDDPYVRLYDWPGDGSLSVIRDWVDVAFQRRDGTPPNNYSKRFKNNRDASAGGLEGMTLADGLLLAGAVIAGAWALERFVLKPLRDRHDGPTQAQGRLRYARPSRHPRQRVWRRDHGSI